MADPIVPDAGGVVENPWRTLQTMTTARIALGRAGVSQPTRHHLQFQLAHARLRRGINDASVCRTASLVR